MERDWDTLILAICAVGMAACILIAWIMQVFF